MIIACTNSAVATEVHVVLQQYAVARVRESSEGGRLHIAFEMGQYLPWVDAERTG